MNTQFVRRFLSPDFFIVKILRCLAAAWLLALAPMARADDFLDPEQAFKVSAKMVEPGLAEVSFTIADGYYLYRERLKFSSDQAKLGTPLLPKGKIKFDETFQKEVETYRKRLVVRLPLQAASDFTLKVGRQGCADQGLCYPPLETELKLSVLAAVSRSASPPATPPAAVPAAAATALASAATAATVAEAAASAGENTATAAAARATELAATPAELPADAESHSISTALKSGKLVAILPLFFLLGLGLSFTPCVLPMVPILSFIIVGEGAGIKRRRGFLLSFSYALGMALVYTALGIAAGLIGEGLSATLQNPWVLGAFALLMAILSLSMFGVYQLQVPAALQTRLTLASEGRRNGKLMGVFLMGSISALIVGPCVAAPLASALVYISQTRDVLVGGTALFAMAMGMSVPLLLVGVSAGSLLPRAGAWMEGVKRFFGVLMLAMALWMVAPVLPAWLQMLAWGALLLAYAGYQLFVHRGGLLSKAIAVLLAALGLSQLVGVSTGGRDVYAPLAHLFGAPAHGVTFVRVRSVAELDAALAQSKGKATLLDFYADWCVSCKEMEKLTFPDAQVKARLDDLMLLQVDVTANNSDDKAMLKRFNLFGPPGIIFFDKQGAEIPGGRVIGYQNADKFLASLRALAPR